MPLARTCPGSNPCSRSCSAVLRAQSPSPTARSRLPSAWVCAFGSLASCCGQSAIWRRSGLPSATRSSSTSCADTCSIPRISACRGNAMLNLAEYRKKPKMLADFLPWAALIAPGVVLNKDGSFQRTARFRGPDLDSATPAELVGTTARLNSALRRLGSGWAIFVESQRNPATDSPDSTFPDSASALLDLERREQFEDSGVLFESSYFLTFVWLPPA